MTQKLKNKNMEEEILNRINQLVIDCPECEYIFHSDDQYQCNTCGSSGKINVIEYLNERFDAKIEKYEDEIFYLENRLEYLSNEI